jgi:acetyltransferase-like isoleucine patch superfamily enzyme
MHSLFQRLLGRLAIVAPGGYTIRPALHRWRGVQLGKRVWIGSLVYLDELYPEAISIGDNVTIGIRSSVFTHFHWGPRKTSGGHKAVVIGPNVFVGPHCVILPGVHIGEGAVVKAGSVLSNNVPPGVFWGQPPGRALGLATVPLTANGSYDDFIKGLRPLHSLSPRQPPDRAPSRPGC